jgi:hypothetical protein
VPVAAVQLVDYERQQQQGMPAVLGHGRVQHFTDAGIVIFDGRYLVKGARDRCRRHVERGRVDGGHESVASPRDAPDQHPAPGPAPKLAVFFVQVTGIAGGGHG